LLAVSLRPFASSQYRAIHPELSIHNDWAKDTVASAAGAVDYVTDVPIECLNYYTSRQYNNNIKKSVKNDNSKDNNNNNSSSKSISSSSITNSLTKQNYDLFWQRAKQCQTQTQELIAREEFVPESVRLFGLGTLVGLVIYMYIFRLRYV
jgi:hypothetical protein